MSPCSAELAQTNAAGWSVLRVQTGREPAAKAQLAARDIPSYLPLVSRQVRHARQLSTVHRPLFPGYLFTPGNISAEAAIVPLVFGFVSFDGGRTPALVPDSEVDRIARMLTAPAAQPWPCLAIGRPVRIILGAMTGLEGILDSYKGAHHVVVNVELLRRGVGVKVDRSMVEAI